MNGFSANRRHQTLAAALSAYCVIAVAPAMSAGLPGDCAGDLDRAVLMDSNGEIERAQALLETLEAHCPDFPQVAHNLGVLAGRQGDWERALHYFERAIDADQRAAMSLEHLRQIHRYRAAQAWRKALDASLAPEADALAPTLSLQDSSVLNSDSHRAAADSDELRTISTLEYELFDWWQSASANNRTAWLTHYARDFAAPEPEQLAQFKWDELQIRISLTRHDAVALVIYPDDLPTSPAAAAGTSAAGSLLLLRLEGNRWKIYEQSPL